MHRRTYDRILCCGVSASCFFHSSLPRLTLDRLRLLAASFLQGKEGPKIPLSDVITILPPKEEIALEATPHFG